MCVWLSSGTGTTEDTRPREGSCCNWEWHSKYKTFCIFFFFFYMCVYSKWLFDEKSPSVLDFILLSPLCIRHQAAWRHAPGKSINVLVSFILASHLEKKPFYADLVPNDNFVLICMSTKEKSFPQISKRNDVTLGRLKSCRGCNIFNANFFMLTQVKLNKIP